MLARITGNKMILGAVVGGVACLVVAVVLFVVIGVGRSSAPPAEAAAATKTTPAKTAVAKPKAKEGEGTRFGPSYVIKDQIVNLADPGGRRYLRFSVALEFEAATDEHKASSPAPTSGFQLTAYEPPADATYQPTAGGGSTDPQKEFEAKIKKYAPAMQDVVTTVLSSKTYAEVASAEGKEQVKKEIKDRINRLLDLDVTSETPPPHVTNVYFTEFVIQ